MAKTTVWKSIETIPRDELVIVYHPLYGYKLRMRTDDGAWYDDYDICEDSYIVWDLWAKLPDKPGPKAVRIAEIEKPATEGTG